jgi:ABC-2 type transport system ATP-binding protein
MPGYTNNSGHSDQPAAEFSELPVLKAENVSGWYGAFQAVDSLSIQVSKGTIFGLVGSDGAGKSTFLRMAATMIKPVSGKILISGLNVVTHKDEVKSIIGYMPQRFGLYQDLTVLENLDFFMDIFGISGDERRKRQERYLGFSNLMPFQDRLAGNLSGGMKQKLALACVLVHQPLLLILDEPTNGVDPVSRQEFWEMLADMKRAGMSILISTAYLDEGEKCDRLALMHRSRILAEGTPSEIRLNYTSLEEAIVQRIQEVDKELTHDRFNI